MERRQQLLRKINKYAKQLRLFLPSAPKVDAPEGFPEEAKLVLPSSYPGMVVNKWFRKVEESLREPAARAALAKLQQHLRTRDVWLDFKKKHVRGVASCTRMNHSIDAVHVRIRTAVAAYRRHRAALLELRGPGKWTDELRELLDVDIRGVNERAYTAKELAESRRRVELARQLGTEPEGSSDDEVGGVYLGKAPVQVGEGRRSLSWLWFNPALLQEGGVADDPRLIGGMHRSLSVLRYLCLYLP